MDIQESIVNRVALSGLITLDLSTLYTPGERVVYDLKDNLFHGLILREKDFREFIKTNDWSAYKDKHVAVICSADAVVPTWAYMLLATYLDPYAATVVYGDLNLLESLLYERALTSIEVEQYADKRVVVKGCADVNVPLFAYMELTTRLVKVAKSVMFG